MLVASTAMQPGLKPRSPGHPLRGAPPPRPRRIRAELLQRGLAPSGARPTDSGSGWMRPGPVHWPSHGDPRARRATPRLPRGSL